MGQASEEQAQCSKSTLKWGLQHSRNEARRGTLSSHHRLTGPQAALQKQLKTLEEAEAKTPVGKKKNDVKTRLLQLENVWALEKEANSGENNMFGVSPFLECQATLSNFSYY